MNVRLYTLPASINITLLKRPSRPFRVQEVYHRHPPPLRAYMPGVGLTISGLIVWGNQGEYCWKKGPLGLFFIHLSFIEKYTKDVY
jgi:hypothetical protein